MPTYSIQGPDGKTYSIDGPEGATREQVIYAIQARMAMPASTDISATEGLKDVGGAIARGVGSLLQFPGQIVQLAPGLAGVGEALQTPGKYVSEFGEDLKSEGLKAREALRSQALTEAEKDGVLSQFAVAIKETVKDPALLSSFLVEQLPLLLGPLGAAKVTQKLGMAGVEAAGKGLTGKAAQEATEEAAKALGKRATGAAYVTGSAMQAGDVSGDTYEEIYKRAIEAGQTPEQAQETAITGARKAAAGAFGASLLAQRLPGAQAIEKRLAGVPAGGRVGAALGEAAGESIEEGAGQFFKNVGLREITPEQALLEGVGGAAGLGALGGGLIGGALGGTKPAPQESLYETANRLNVQVQLIDQEIKALTEAGQPAPDPAELQAAINQPTEQDIARKEFGLMTNSELVDMYRTQGYGAVKQYQQQLVSRAESGELPTPERKQAINLAQDIQDFLIQSTKEEVERKQEIEPQSFLFDKKALNEFGVSKSSPVYDVLLNKDVAKPEDAEVVVASIENLLTSGSLNSEEAYFAANTLERVNEFLQTVPGSGFYASSNFEPSTGAGIRLADEPGSQPAAGGVEPAKPAGVGAAGESAKPPVGREGTQPASLTAQEPVYDVMEVSREESPTGKRGYSVFRDGEPGPYFPSKELAERWIRKDKKAVAPEAIQVPEPTGEEVEFKQPSAPLPPAVQMGEEAAKSAEAQVRKIRRESPSLWTALRGKLSYSEVSDIGPGLRFKPLMNPRNTGSISTLVADGALDEFLPPDRRAVAGMGGPANNYDEYDNTEYIKDLLRQGGDSLLSYDTKTETAQIFGSIAEAEQLIKEYLSEADINAEIKSAETEIREATGRATSEELASATLPKRPSGTAEKPSGEGKPEVKKSVRPETERKAGEVLKKLQAETRPEEDVETEEVAEKGAEKGAEEAAPKAEPVSEEQRQEAIQKLTETRKELVSELDYTLKKILAKYGLKDVKFDLDEAMQEEGSYARQLIKIALNVDNPVRVLRHESIHALKDMGFFSPSQWKVLEKRAQDEWVEALKATPHSDTQSRYDAYVELFTQEAADKGITGDAVAAYVDEAVIEEAIADAFGAYDTTKAPVGLLTAILNRMRNLFKAIKEAFGAQGIESAEDIFGKIEEGKLKPAPEVSNKSSKTEEDQAKAYLRENGIMPYTSAGPIDVDLAPPKYSLQKFNPEKHLKFDPTLGVPINRDGTVTVYYHTTKEKAKEINATKKIPSDGRSRVYLTNESSGAEALRNPGSFDQEFDGSTVLLYVTPEMLQVETEYDNGRVDFFIPLTEGAYYSQKMKWHSVQKARTSAITDQFSYSAHASRIKAAIDMYQSANAARKKVLLRQAKDLLKREHNVGSLLTENGKLEKTRIGEYDLDYDGLPVASAGLGLASAQKISDKVSTCPRSAICEGLCLGETSGGNFMFGGAASEDVGEISKNAFRAAARMMQYLKTEALIVNPEAFSILLQAEIDNLAKRSAKPTQRVKIDGKTTTVEKGVYRPAVRLNVTSDFKPEMFEAVIRANPEVMFYDYTKINSDKIADNHHLTYSSEGFGQIVDGEKIFFKDKAGNYAHNWSQVRARLNEGSNVAMAFTNKRGNLPKFLEDEETGVKYRVLDGDLYDARFLDEFSSEKRDSNGLGVIVGLRNKAGNIAEKIATKKTEGFFVNYEPSQGDTVTVPNQNQFKRKTIAVKQEKLSLRAPQTQEFKQFLSGSKAVDEKGEAIPHYHATLRDFSIFKGDSAGAIFLSPDPEFSNAYFAQKLKEASERPSQYLSAPEIRAAVKRLREYVYENYGRQSKASKDMLLSLSEAEDVGKKTGVYKFPGELSDAWQGSLYGFGILEGALPSGRSIMPLYVNTKNPFDFEDKKQVDKLLKQLAKSEAVDEKMTQMGRFTKWPAPTQTAEEQEKIVKDYYRENILDGDWRTIELPEVQDAIKALNHDGFYINEAGEYGDIVKNLAVYSSKQLKSATGNIGTYGQRPVTSREADILGMSPGEAAKAQEEGDIRLSLRAPQTEAFKRWFGDSKIVDANGEPLVVYHGTDKDFSAFKDDGEPIFLTPMPRRADVYSSRDGGNVMPLYARVENPASMKQYEQARHANRGKDARKKAVELLKSQGYDGVVDDITVVVFSPAQVKSAISNVGAFSRADSDIRLSLRRSVASAMTPAMQAAMDKIAPRSYDPGLKERILNHFQGDGYTFIRSQLINRYERLAEYDRRVAKMIEQAGGVQQLADQRAESAALFSDLTAGLLETAMGAVDKFGGAPVFRNGITTISSFNKSVKGPILIFKPLSDLGDPDAFRLYQTWAAVKRGSRLLAEGRGEPISQTEINAVRAMEKANPNLVALFEAVQKDWIRYNDKLVAFMRDTGVLSPAMAVEYTKHGDYFPFYRLIDEDVAGPKMFTSIGNVKQPKKLKGSDAPLGDFFENIVRNSQAAIQAGIKNVAAQKATQQALLLKEVERLPKKDSGVNVYRVFENGQEVYYRSHDPLFIDAIKALNIAEMPFMGILSGPANLLRNLVTKDPAFMLANMMRDSLSAYVTTGVKMTPIVDTLKNFTTAISGRSPEMQKLYAAGVLGGYDYAQGVKTSAADFEKRLRELSGQKTTFEKAVTPFTSVWGALEKGTQASDAATRIEIYKKTLAETGSEAEAYWAALEVMNFNRRGKSPVIRILTAAIPFLNARIQGLDLLFRTAIYPASSEASKQAKERMKTFWVRGMTMMALSTMYWFMVHDDDDYKKQEQETKDNYWLIPGMGIKIPIPFEVGVMFKVIPERIAAVTFGNDTARDFTESMTRQFVSTFGFNFIPQAALPFYEAKTNFSFFTQREILGQAMKGVAPEYQIGPGTSRAAEVIAGAFSWLPPNALLSEILRSPALVDHLIKGYTGTMGQYASDLFNAIYDMGSEKPKADKRFQQMPVIRRFLIDPEARGSVTAYYELKKAVDEAVRTSNFLERSMNFDEYGKYYSENMNVLAVRDYVKDIDASMKEAQQMRQMIQNSTMSGADKKDALLAVGQLEAGLTQNIQDIKKLANR